MINNREYVQKLTDEANGKLGDMVFNLGNEIISLWWEAKRKAQEGESFRQQMDDIKTINNRIDSYLQIIKILANKAKEETL